MNKKIILGITALLCAATIFAAGPVKIDGYNWLDIAVADDGTILACNTTGDMYVSSDKGASFTKVEGSDQHLVCTHLDAPLGDAVAGGGVALGVQIHDQNLFAQRGHTGREVDGGGGLAHTALLICHCYDLTHGILPLCGMFHVEHSLFHYALYYNPFTAERQTFRP